MFSTNDQSIQEIYCLTRRKMGFKLFVLWAVDSTALVVPIYAILKLVIIY